MSQCVPSWELDENPTLPPRIITSTANTSSNSLTPDVPTLDYEVAELTWKNGQLAMHGFGMPRLPSRTGANINSLPAKCSWDKPPAGGTLESIVNQATTKPVVDAGDELVRWFDNKRSTPAASIAMTMNGPSPRRSIRDIQEPSSRALESLPGIGMACSTRVGSCTVATNLEDGKEVRVARLPHDWSSRIEQSVSGSDTRARESCQGTHDTCERDLGTAGFTSTSQGSPGNTSSAKDGTKTVDDHDSAYHSKNQREGGDEDDTKKETGKSSVPAKRSRCAAIHNQSERKRRDKINQRMKTLQKLVPNSSKTDKASVLDEVIEYLKQLQAQVHMMSRMNMSTLMLPLALQQQLQMSMGMGMGMNMGMGLGFMDVNAMACPNINGMPPHVPHLNPFMPIISWDIQGDRLPPSPDPFSAFLACQSQPMTMDAYWRMVSLYQPVQAPSAPTSKSKVI